MRWLILFLLLPSLAFAETWSGHPRIVDGDTIALEQGRVRLLNIDAFETSQNCLRDGTEYGCGSGDHPGPYRARSRPGGTLRGG